MLRLLVYFVQLLFHKEKDWDLLEYHLTDLPVKNVCYWSCPITD